MESMLLLLIADRAWRRFGRYIVLVECIAFSAFVGLGTYAVLDRTSETPELTTNATRCVLRPCCRRSENMRPSTAYIRAFGCSACTTHTTIVFSRALFVL